MQCMVVGADGKEYGPTDLAMLQTWVADRRLLPHTVLRDVQTGQTFHRFDAKDARAGRMGELPGNEENLQACVIDAAMFASSPTLVAQAKAMSLTPAQKRIVERYRDAAIDRQVRGYPRLRSRFAKLYRDKLWESDIDVAPSGVGNRTISFTGGVFSANRNIKAFMDGAQENLRAMRYSQARFRWYKGADEYT